MRIGLISDTHNDQQRLKLALSRFQEHQINILLHAGDITNVRTLRLLDGFDVWAATGNMDSDPELPPVAKELFGAGRMARVHRLTLNGTHIAMTHGDNWQELEALICSEEYNYVIHGHTHIPQDQQVGPTRVINPGALGNNRWRPPTCAILNLNTGDLEWIEL